MASITITWSEENFIIHPYQGFRVGPVSVTTEVGPNETYQDVYNRVWPQLEAIGKAMFLAKRNGWAERYLARN